MVVLDEEEGEETTVTTLMMTMKTKRKANNKKVENIPWIPKVRHIPTYSHPHMHTQAHTTHSGEK